MILTDNINEGKHWRMRDDMRKVVKIKILKVDICDLFKLWLHKQRSKVTESVWEVALYFGGFDSKWDYSKLSNENSARIPQ